MKDVNLRGVVTDEIAEKHGVSLRQLRLLPYLQYLLLNSKPVDPAKITEEERGILRAWRDEGSITFSASEPCTCTKEFWDWTNEVLFDGYVLEKED